MKSVRLAVGNPTGHHDQYSTTLALDGYMLRGSLPITVTRALADVLRQGARATGQDFDISLPRRKNAPTE